MRRPRPLLPLPQHLPDHPFVVPTLSRCPLRVLLLLVVVVVVVVLLLLPALLLLLPALLLLLPALLLLLLLLPALLLLLLLLLLFRLPAIMRCAHLQYLSTTFGKIAIAFVSP